jgi:hypothetical protein
MVEAAKSLLHEALLKLMAEILRERLCACQAQRA